MNPQSGTEIVLVTKRLSFLPPVRVPFNIKKSGWKLVITVICGMIGTSPGRVIIADVTPRLMD
ncbi:hypothetical protein D2T29_03310 [Sinirhodobacter populi]|uniref:Uncharacterized protein n=1 Tax=Paenirhodobacter populi TaxID=2306993 RepID=A0A443KNW4_9RHOB|nr:hypothetical protein [Sinirhodobacter populi]RWR34585.1 hypothetical protein D2T29_03310 [Sinirhodobacter populi]